MGKRRAQAVKAADRAMRRKQVARMVKGLRVWTVSPTFTGEQQQQRPGLIAPQMLVGRLSEMLLHPAWKLEGEDIVEDPVMHQAARDGTRQGGLSPTDAVPGGVGHLLGLNVQKCEQLHDLRKHIRELRYAMELVQPLYKENGDYSATLEYLILRQAALGDLQDLEVLAECLCPRAERLPHVVAAIADRHSRGWERWGELRAELITEEGRAGLYGPLLRPGSSEPGVLAAQAPRNGGDGRAKSGAVELRLS
mmetsp:Transcript_27440/g.87947  ORF Transcript_27440/g.87947 Transcript_27440/m.87947 type:complete len:251 (-) Transcript_27440:75-827(-)